MTIGKNLKHWRQVRGMTQPELAEKAEIEQSYLSKLENGHSQPSEGVRDRLAEALGIDVDTLMRDPSSNGHMRRRLVIGITGVALLIAGFAAGYLASDYEVRKVNREGQRLTDIWTMAPAGIRISGIEEEMPRRPGVRHVMGNYESAESVRVFAAQLLDSGLLGTKLESIQLSESGMFSIMISGERFLPQSTKDD